jgi:hypothetical protein
VLHVAIGSSTRSKLVHAQALLGHAVPSGDVAQLLDRALDALIEKVEGRKFGRVARPRARSGGSSVRARQVPAAVRRAVWQRDGGQCTFVSPGGHLCGSRAFLEYDHVDPVARGGTATVERMRLRCRTHNRLEAERVFGRAFMDAKRREAQEVDRDVVAALRGLGMGAREAERVARDADIPPDAPIEERLRIALQSIRTPRIHREEPASVPRGT